MSPDPPSFPYLATLSTRYLGPSLRGGGEGGEGGHRWDQVLTASGMTVIPGLALLAHLVLEIPHQHHDHDHPHPQGKR